ncbi:alkaline phosphatase synthesis sensor protein PhoR [Gottschalkia purinilytica]|uniref:histidine kinase n=1 Tax=Gottschalkia purinilytica TaxID=1503 RepID=A0A0L0W7K7_GOTPU|nr:alkaline phosphatase synthesis sensor protein PhoR [Gottschalkia purinilytica]
MQGIKKRWVYNYIIIVSAVLLIVEGAFVILIKNYYYGNITQNLSNTTTTAADFYNRYLSGKQDTLHDIAQQIIQGFSKDYSELQVLDTKGNIIMSSSGFLFKDKVDSQDYIKSLKGQVSTWTGKDKNTKENIMIVSSPIMQEKDKIVGVVRNITSLEEVNKVIRKLFTASFFTILIILLIMLSLSILFSRSIINPLNEINGVAQKMAKGQFSERIEKHYNDEIGELADTLNYMAGEIVNSTRLKNDFISSISHELRTPLTSIKGWSETILTGGLKDKEEAELGLKIIIKETTRLSQMVEELLDFSKIESGRIVLHLEKINVKDDLEDVIHICKLRALKDGVILEYSSEEDIPFIMADKNRLRQVFINIIDNAVKFTDKGKHVFVNIYCDDKNTYIKIKDEGTGISPEDLSQVKEKFFKGTSKKSGSGIGLAVSDEIIKLHNGSLTIDSELGEGTTVLITLPQHSE